MAQRIEFLLKLMRGSSKSADNGGGKALEQACRTTDKAR